MKTEDLKKIIDTLLHQNLMVVSMGTVVEPDLIVGGTKDLSRELVNLFLLYGVSNQRELLHKLLQDLTDNNELFTDETNDEVIDRIMQ